jgi:hypothetical protein
MGPRPSRTLPARRQHPLRLHRLHRLHRLRRLHPTQHQTVILGMTTASYARSAVSLWSMSGHQEVTDR